MSPVCLWIEKNPEAGKHVQSLKPLHIDNARSEKVDSEFDQVSTPNHILYSSQNDFLGM